MLIHLPAQNKCIRLNMIWQTMDTSWIGDAKAAEKKCVCIYLAEALNSYVKTHVNLRRSLYTYLEKYG